MNTELMDKELKEEQKMSESPDIKGDLVPENTNIGTELINKEGDNSASMDVDNSSEQTPVVEAAETDETSEISKYFPNVEVTDANRDELESAVMVMGEHEEMKPRHEKMSASQKELAVIINANPELRGTLLDLRDGASWAEAVARNIDTETLTPAEGDPDREKWGVAKQERTAAHEKKMQRQQTIKDNEEKAQQVLNSFKDRHELDDESALKFIQFADGLLGAAFDGDLTDNLLEGLYYIQNRDTDIENAKKDGELSQKNANIEDYRDKEEDVKGDGIPDLTAGSSVKETNKRPASFGANFMKGVLD